MKTVILIDDDPDELDLLRQAIAEYYGRVNCLAYTDPEEALKFILSDAEIPPDAVFIDINMPRLTGDMCLQVLRKELALSKVVIAMFSTTMDTENKAFLIRSGADFAFQKPYKVDAYRQVVLEVLHFDRSKSPDMPGSSY